MRILHLEKTMPDNYCTLDVWDWGNNTLRLMLTVFYAGRGKRECKQYSIYVPNYRNTAIELLSALRNIYSEMQEDKIIAAGQLAIKQLFEL